MEELRILAAGYGKFNQYKTDDSNPANKVAKAFKEEYLKGDHTKCMPDIKGYHVVIPVVWEEAWSNIRKTVKELQPDALICMGAAPETKFERMARNEAYTKIPDAEGKDFQKPYIVEDHENLLLSAFSGSRSFYSGRERTRPDYDNAFKPLATYRSGIPTPYFFPTTLPCDYLENRMNQESNSNVLKVANASEQLSFDARGYLCNLAFYMSALLLHGKVGFTGFLHVEAGQEDIVYEETGKFIFKEYAKWLQINYIRVPRHLHSAN